MMIEWLVVFVDPHLVCIHTTGIWNFAVCLDRMIADLDRRFYRRRVETSHCNRVCLIAMSVRNIFIGVDANEGAVPTGKYSPIVAEKIDTKNLKTSYEEN